jgi:hypothetical protein
MLRLATTDRLTGSRPFWLVGRRAGARVVALRDRWFMDDCGDGFIDTDGLCPTGADMRGSDRLSLTVSRTIWRFAVEADVPFFFPGHPESR